MKIKCTCFILLLCIIQFFLAKKIYAGAEYVYIQKTMGNKDMIVRKSGDDYLMEKGFSCLSLFCYKGKAVLISTTDNFLGVSFKLLMSELNEEYEIWNSESHGFTKTYSPFPSWKFKKNKLKDDCTEKHWIKSKSDDGSIIILEDGTVWEVDVLDRINSMLWLPTEDVIICNEEMINLSNDEKVDVLNLR